MGDSASAQTHLRAALDLYDRQLHHGLAHLYGGHDPGVCSRGYLGWTSFELGDPDQARESVRVSLRLATDLGHALTDAIGLMFVILVHYHRREREVAAEHIDALARITREHGLAAWSDQAIVLQSVLRVARGESAADAVARARQLSLASWRALVSLGLLADACREAGQPERRLDSLAEAWEIAGGEPAGFYAPELHRIRGELLLARDASAAVEAEACFRRAYALAHARGARSFELRAAMSLARLAGREGRRGEARSLLAECYRTFTKGFDTADLRAAGTLLDELP